MADGVTIRLDKFDLVSEAVRRGVSKGLRALGFAVQEEAQNNIREVGAIDHGALFNSVYTQTSQEDGRPAAVAAAVAAAGTIGVKSKRPGVGIPALEGERVSDDLTVKVGVCMEHGVYVEMGTSRMDERPYLAPAVATIEGKAEQAMARYVAEEVK